MRRKPLLPVFLVTGLLALAGGLAGCVGPRMPALAAPLPAAWPLLPAAAAVPSPDLTHWWSLFDDPVLDGLVRSALAQNLAVEAARQRLQGERRLAAHSADPFLPELHARAQPVQSPDGVDSFFQYGLDATWELGLFGRRRAAGWVQQSHLVSASAELQALRVSLVAEVVRTYVELRAAQAALALHQELAEVERQRVAVLDTRARLGLAAPAEVASARAALGREAADLPQRQQDIDLAGLRLALLLGQSAADPAWRAPSPLPVPAVPGLAAVPADLLRSRPEIRVAEAGVMAAAGELGIARSELYPYVGIGGALMYSLNLTDNFTFDGDTLHLVPSLGPTLDLPLFDWGRRRAAADARAAMLDAAVTDYRRAVLQAVNDVEVALATLQGAQASRQALRDSLQQRLAGAADQQSLAGLGLASPLASLDARRELLQARLGMAEADAGQGLALVALYKALGGAPLADTAGRG